MFFLEVRIIEVHWQRIERMENRWGQTRLIFDFR